MLTYRREVDGLRALAVLPVILFHAGFGIFKGGFVGVDVFFVISGYLITSILLSEKERGTFSLLKFYERRARRILPALFVMMVVSMFFAWIWLLPRDMKDFSGSLAAVSIFSSNIFFWNASGYFDTAAELKPLLHTWSLAVEEQYYLLFPVFLMATWQLGKKFIIYTLLLIFIASLLAAQINVNEYPAATFYLLPTRAWELVMGALIAFYLFGGNDKKLGQFTAQFGAGVGFLLIVFSAVYFDKNTPFPSFYALVPTVGAALVILCATPTTFVGKLLGAKIFVAVGLVSYSAYLWHQPLFAFARYKISPNLSLEVIAVLLLLTAICAYLSWRFIEGPFRQARAFSPKQVASFSALVPVCCLTFGFAGYATEGNFARYDAASMDILAFTEEKSDFVWAKADKLGLKDFDGGADNKILVIGDSMAADFINVLHETEYYDKSDISFYRLEYACGNLYLDESFIDKVDPDHRQQCLNGNWYDKDKLKKLLVEADRVILVSVWTPWQIELLGKSLYNLERDFGKDKFFVVGRKFFGVVDLLKLSSLNFDQRISYRSSQDAGIDYINKLLSSAVKKDRLLDLESSICQDGQCPLFDMNGKLMSSDGSHLTPAGAKYVAEKIIALPILKSLMNQ
ncbi:acyltransferase family protein [Pseudomonas sp. MF6776]|uniref:acyltransferase family protein n=1 Tax=Pseudomonas sp. MF6776 TaxID=2797534 RepID=UPI00190B8D11|nr:acyltransferase family protein [Pseudomonas sp. MF6776]MBK3464562.1 acyltransferase [Pseudomonas sp. MF6776]